MNKTLQKYFQNLKRPDPDSHKGQNGKLMIIGGSELFHGASKWSLDIASKFVDMVFYSSVPSNNQLIKEAKGEFWNGIVVERTDLDDYIHEADVVLIGPGMKRDEETAQITNQLVTKYPNKKWVIDAGALQVIEPKLIPPEAIITPHHQEIKRLAEKMPDAQQFLIAKGVTILLKGQVDVVTFADQSIKIEGGNAGMTKGGTGDVLAGLVAALYCTNDALTSAITASYINKKTGEKLFEQVGPFYNASDLVEMLPKIFWQHLV